MRIKTMVLCATFVLAGPVFGQQVWASPHGESGELGTRVSVIPVLVTVSAKGKVTGIVPAYRLRANIQRLVESTILQMVSGPAIAEGKSTASQIIVKLKLHPELRDDGKYSLSLEYGGAEPLPYGTWHWIVDARRKLRLVNSALTPQDDPLQHRFNTSYQEILNPNPHGLD